MGRSGNPAGAGPVEAPGGQRAGLRGGAAGLALAAGLAILAPGEVAALDPGRGLGQYVHDRFTDRQGLPQNAVRALLSSRRGELWIGTDEGLARFDGVRFTVYDRRSSPALGSNLVYHLAEDASGAI
jgi:ligand-binding sensor domain-containing protein